MPSGARLNLRDSQRIRSFLDGLDPRISGSVADQACETIARLTEQRAKEVEIVRGRGNSPPLARQLSFRTGRLSRSISTDLSQRPKNYIVGTSVVYSSQHELGLAPYPKRAFLQPAADFIVETKGYAAFKKAFDRLRASS